MPRSSRHKSHKQSKHSSKEARGYSDSEGEELKVKESGSGRISKDSGNLGLGEKRKLALQLKEGKDLSGHANGDALDEYVSSKRRKEKADASGGGDRWNGGGDGREETGVVYKESRGGSLKIDGEKGSKSRESKGESKSRSSRRHESGGEKKEENVVSVVEKEENRSGSRSEAKRKSEKEKDGKDSKEFREKERGSEREKKVQESNRDTEAYVERDLISRQGSQLEGKSSRSNTEWSLQDEIRNSEIDKEPEKRIRKKKEGNGDGDKYQEDFGDGGQKQLSSRGDRAKDGRYRDEKHREGNYVDKCHEDGHRDDRNKDVKYREDADRDNKHREDKYRDDGDRDTRYRDDKYRDDGDRDIRRKADKHREGGDRENNRRDDKHREVGDRESQRWDEKYREDGERDNRRKDEKYREDIEKENGRSDGRFYEEVDIVGKHKDDKHREDGDRDNRHKEEKYRDDSERENRHRDGKQGDDFDRERRLREAKYRDDHVLKDRSGDKSDTKLVRDENHASESNSRKASLQVQDQSPGYDDRMTRPKDDHGRRKTSDKEDHTDIRVRSIKDQISEAEKRFAGSGRADLVTERGRSTSRMDDIDLAGKHSRRRRSPSSGSHSARDQYRLSKQEESKYRDYAYEERARHSVKSNREYGGGAGLGEKRLNQKEDSHFGELAAERRFRSEARASPLPLIDKSPSSTSTERRHLSRSDVRRSQDADEYGQRSGGSRDGKDYSGRGGRDGDEVTQGDGDNLSVSSPFTRTGHLSSSSKSLLPPPFRSGVDSPLPFGGSEDDNRGKSNSRYKRIGDPNMGRLQGNSWRGIPNWPSPVTNGFMPFQHGPPPVGFHPIMQQFPPPMFGVRPSIELNHPGVPYHMPNADRFSGHVRPLGWRNSDDSCPPSLQGWDANNAVFGENSHIFGRADWDGRSLPSVRSWEASGDMWKGPNSGASSELQSAPEKENNLGSGGTNESLSGQSNHLGQLELQVDDNKIGQLNNAPKWKSLEPSTFGPEETPIVYEKSKSDDGHLCNVYLSKLDMSVDLIEPEVYVHCTGLMDISDDEDSNILYMERAEDAGLATLNKLPGSLVIAATDDTVFQKAMSFYEKYKEDFTVIRRGSLPQSNVKNESVPLSDHENLGLEDGDPHKMAVDCGEQEPVNVLPNVSKEVNLPDSIMNVEGVRATASEDGADVSGVDKSEDPVSAMSNTSMVDKSEDPVSAMSNTSMEVQVTSDVEIQELIVKNTLPVENVIKDRVMEENLLPVQIVGQAFDHAPASVDESIMPSILKGDSSDSNNEGKEMVETKSGPMLFSEKDVPEACEAVMPESIESGSVNLSRIHHSPESSSGFWLPYLCHGSIRLQRGEHFDPQKMSSHICRSASRAVRSFLSASSKQSSRAFSEGRAAATAAAATVSLRGGVPALASLGRTEAGNASTNWISGFLAVPAAVYMLQEQEAHAAEMERTFIAIKPDGVQRALISEIISRFERKGFKLVGIKVLVPSKDFAEKHYHDLKERPFFNGLCDFLSSGPVIAMVWEGEGVIKYGRKLIGATDPQKSEPGTIRGDLAVVVGRNIIHGSDGPETAKDEIKLWFQPEELVNYTSNSEKWIYEAK